MQTGMLAAPCAAGTVSSSGPRPAPGAVRRAVPRAGFMLFTLGNALNLLMGRGYLFSGYLFKSGRSSRSSGSTSASRASRTRREKMKAGFSVVEKGLIYRMREKMSRKGRPPRRR